MDVFNLKSMEASSCHGFFAPDQRQRTLNRVMADITGSRHLNKRRDRSYPRVVKRARTTTTTSRNPATTAPAMTARP